MKKRLTFHQLLFEQQILGILLFTVLVIFLWVISSIYFSYSASTLTSDDELTVISLNPAIPERPLQDLNARRWWSDIELSQFSVNVLVNDKTIKIVPPIGSPSAELTTTPASESATPNP